MSFIPIKKIDMSSNSDETTPRLESDGTHTEAKQIKMSSLEACLSSNNGADADSEKPLFSNLTFEEMRQLSDRFIKERNWDQFHSPRNVLLALVGEVGELAEIFQWKGEVSEGLPELSESEREHVGQEVSDVLLYLIDFASRCKIDLPAAVLNKMAANARKYPVDKSFGKSNKYTDYQGENGDNDQL